MNTIRTNATADARGRETAGSFTSSLRFSRRLAPLGAFLLLTSAWFVAVPLFVYPLVESVLAAFVAQSAAFFVVVLVAWAVLRWEGVSARAVGLHRGTVLPGVLPVLLVYLFVNAVAAATLVVSGDPVRFGTAEPLAYWVGTVLVQVTFVGVAEEFGYRAYLQNKLVALFGGGTDRRLMAVAIVVGAVLFTAAHLPQRILIQGLDDPVAIGQTLVPVVVLGVLLGVLYEYTRNVVLVAVLHGTFNVNPVVVLNAPTNLALLLALPVFAVLLWRYRHWAVRTMPEDFGPQTLADGAAAT